MDTLLQPSYVYDETLSKQPLDSDSFLVKQKNLTPTIDQRKGSGAYTSSKVIIDAQNFGNGTDFIDWANAYITLPYHFKLDALSSGTPEAIGEFNPDMLVAAKNMSLVDSLRVEQAGRTIIQESANLSHIVNFIKHTSTSVDELYKQGTVYPYWPDDSNLLSVSASAQGVWNNQNWQSDTSTSQGAVRANYNDGLFKRQLALQGGNEFTTYMNSTGYNNEDAVVQDISGASMIIGNTYTTISDQHFIAVIKLSDLSDYFKKHPLSKCGYKLTLTINQCETVITAGSISRKPFDSSPAYTITSSNTYQNSTVQPGMIIVGRHTWNAQVQNAATSLTYTLRLTSEIDTSANSRQQGVILYTPSYVLSDQAESKLLSQPIVNKQPYMFNSAVYTNLTANNNINLQLFSAITNPRILVVIPQYSSASQTRESQLSPFNPCPGTTDPLSLTRIQIRVNSKTILPAPTSYGFEQFIQNTQQVLGLNGAIGPLQSGLIDIRKFMTNYRYYAFDLSLLPADQIDIPQLITFEAYNNNIVNVDLYVYCIYQTSATFDLLKGTVDVK